MKDEKTGGPLRLARVQRDYGRMPVQLGLEVAAPKPSGKAPGWPGATDWRGCGASPC